MVASPLRKRLALARRRRLMSKWLSLPARARRNADEIVVRRTSLASTNLPPAFDDFTILHLSDLHADISEDAMRWLAGIVRALEYDICVLTGDYRGEPYGPFTSLTRLQTRPIEF